MTTNDQFVHALNLGTERYRFVIDVTRVARVDYGT